MEATATTCGCSYCVEGGSGEFRHYYPENPVGMILDRAAFLKLAHQGPSGAARLEAEISALDAPDLWACTIFLWNYDETIRCGMASFGGFESRLDLIAAILELADGANLSWRLICRK